MAKRVPDVVIRDAIWKTLVEFNGDREKVAAKLGMSLRSLYRYMSKLDMYPDIDKAGLIKHKGPPRVGEPRDTERDTRILRYIERTGGNVSFSDLAIDIYGESNMKTIRRVYLAAQDLRTKGKVAVDGDRWFII